MRNFHSASLQRILLGGLAAVAMLAATGCANRVIRASRMPARYQAAVVTNAKVAGLGRLATTFPTATRLWTAGRVVIAGAMGTAVAVALAGSAGNPVGVAPVRELAETAQTEGGGKNVVNLILTDTRALDTLGEVIVLMVVAVGILTLGAKRRRGRPSEVAT